MKWLVAIALIWLAWRYLGRKPRRGVPNEEARARKVLGVSLGADEQAIRAAHRRLLAEVHPDRGGSAAATTEINAARDLLLDAARRG